MLGSETQGDGSRGPGVLRDGQLLKLYLHFVLARLNELDPSVLQALLQPVPSQTAQQLPARVLRHRVDELDPSEPLVLRLVV